MYEDHILSRSLAWGHGAERVIFGSYIVHDINYVIGVRKVKSQYRTILCCDLTSAQRATPFNATSDTGQVLRSTRKDKNL